MQQCWKTQPDGRPTFKAIVKDIEGYLAEMMNYFNLLDSNGRRPSDPYITWNLVPLAEEDADDASRTDQPEQAATTEHSFMTRQQFSNRQANLFEQKRHSVANSDSRNIVQRFVSLAGSVSFGMKRRSTSNITVNKKFSKRHQVDTGR